MKKVEDMFFFTYIELPSTGVHNSGFVNITKLRCSDSMEPEKIKHF